MSTAVPSTARVLVRGATVLSVDPEIGDLPRGDVLIEGDTIAAVGPDLSDRAAGAETVDADGLIAVPGFVDCHVHAWEGLLRGLAPVADFGAYLGLTAFGHGPRYTPDDMYLGTLTTALVALDGGTTTVVDNCHNALSVDHALAAARGLVEAGVRGVHAVGAPFGAPGDDVPATALAVRRQVATALLDVRLFDVNPSVDLWTFAAAEGFHVSSETGPHTADLEAVFTALAGRGLLDARHSLNHCYDLPERVWDMIAEGGAAVNLCARSDAAFGLGSTVPPVDQALGRGITVGLSNDNEVSYGVSMFAEMAALHLRHRGEVFRRAAAGDPAPGRHLTPAQVLHMATQGGAVNAGLGDRVGSLTPGKQADLVLLRSADVALPPADPVGAVTAFATARDVDTVLVAGRFRKRGGRVLDVDVDAVRARAGVARTRLLAAR